MYIEYCNYNKTIEDYNKELSLVFKAIEKNVNGICIPIHMYHEIKNFVPEGVVCSVPIDYPSGYSSTKTKNHSVLNAVKGGVQSIDYVMNNYLFQSKPNDLEKEIKSVLNICRDYNSTLRIFIDNRLSKDLIGTSKYLSNLGIEFCYPTIGYHHDSFVDTLINCKLIEKHVNINTIFNGYFWTEEQYNILKRSNIFGIRVYNTKFWCNYN
jgi:deoxyribose-phosphate aldolase